MVQKAEMIIEKFNQGITIRWRDLNDEFAQTKSLAPAGQENAALGKMLYADICDVFDNVKSDKIVINLEYKVLDD